MSETDSQIKVAIFEDDKMWQEMARQEIESLGCMVVAMSGSMVEALDQIIPQLEAMGVSFVLVDGNMSEDAIGGHDGRVLAKRVKEAAPSVLTVGFSGSKQEYVDRQLGKADFSTENLKKAFGIE